MFVNILGYYLSASIKKNHTYIHNREKNCEAKVKNIFQKGNGADKKFKFIILNFRSILYSKSIQIFLHAWNIYTYSPKN